MKEYKYKGKKIVASSKEEAIKQIIATSNLKDTIHSAKDITDDIYLKYAKEALQGKNSEVFEMDELDNIVPSSEEAIKLALIGHNYPERESTFNLSCDYFTFYKGNGGLMSISKDKLLTYLKEEIDSYDLFEYLKDNYLDYEE